MHKKTVHVTSKTLLIAAFFLVILSVVSIAALAQSATPGAFMPLVNKDGAPEEAVAPAPTVPSVAPSAAAEITGEASIHGYPVPDYIYQYYQQLGPEVAGKPLTEFRYNAQFNRFEMLFENVGLYVAANDPLHTVRMLPLGIQRAFSERGSGGREEAIPISPGIIRLFDQVTSRLGKAVTGNQLVPLAMEENGSATRIFENVVMKVNPETPGRIAWQPLPELLGIPAQKPVPAVKDSRFTFYQLDNLLGHNIPLEFWDFIRNNADLTVTGEPITEIFYGDPEQKIIRQCFKHMCLDYVIASGEIRPAALGTDYYRRFYQAGQQIAGAPASVSIHIWEAQAAIPPDDLQVIYARIAQDNLPVINLQPLLEVTLPDGTRETYQMPASNAEGISALQIPGIQAENSTIIPYQVCLLFVDASRYCVADQYIIWNSP
jgi:hypothetical protein